MPLDGEELLEPFDPLIGAWVQLVRTTGDGQDDLKAVYRRAEPRNRR